MTPPLLPLLLAALDVTVQPPASPPAQLDWEQPVACLFLKPTARVPSGEFRVQCRAETRTCYAAPNAVLVDGVAGEEELSRANKLCFDRREGAITQALAEGWRWEEAVAEAPPGWYRDERGRVMQVNFDLLRRVHFGGAYAPFYRADGNGSAGRARVDFGVDLTLQGETPRVLHRFRFLESAVWLGVPNDVRVEATGLRYDFVMRGAGAPLWLTTFVGQPRRHDLNINLGWGAEAVRVEVLGGRSFVTLAQVDGAVDFWTSKDVESFVRLRVGPSLEIDTALGAYFRPAATLEGHFTLDRDGFHHLDASVTGEQLLGAQAVAGRPTSPQRLKLRVGYELILLAINDYPLTLVVDGRGTWRSDVPALPGWEFAAHAGLRFSLWAPPRRTSVAVHAPKPKAN